MIYDNQRLFSYNEKMVIKLENKENKGDYYLIFNDV